MGVTFIRAGGRFSVTFLLSALMLSPAFAGEVLMGQMSIVDGDTLKHNGVRIRLQGMDAPESNQTCVTGGKAWRCGQQAALALYELTNRKHLRCEVSGYDRNKRPVATCYLGELNLNRWLVQSGWAMDWPRYSKGRYADDQQTAKAADLNIWASEFIPPWEFRRLRRQKKK